MKSIFSQKSKATFTAVALTASLLSASAAFAAGRTGGGGDGGTATGCGCGNTGSTSTPGGPNTGGNTHNATQDMCVVAPQLLTNDGTTITFRGHIERWAEGNPSSAREIDTYNQIISMKKDDFVTMLKTASAPRSQNLFGIGDDKRRVFRLSWGDRTLGNPEFIAQACTRFNSLLGEYNATLGTPVPPSRPQTAAVPTPPIRP